MTKLPRNVAAGAARSTKITETTLIPNLLFALTGVTSPSQLSELNEKDQPADSKLRSLRHTLSLVFELILLKEFDRERFPWITDSFIKDNFQGRKFNQYNHWLDRDKINYRSAKSWKFRNVFSSICAVSRELLDGSQTNSDMINSIRNELGLVSHYENQKERMAVLGQIEHELKRRSTSTRPDWHISYDAEHQPIVKTNRKGYFPNKDEISEDKSSVVGRFLLYRRSFLKEKEFIREYITIDSKNYGVVFRWESINGARDRHADWNGIGLFLEGAFWLIGCADSSKRIRILAANIADWQRHSKKPKENPYCMATITSHFEYNGEKIPVSRQCILKRETEGTWEELRVKNLTRTEILYNLTLEEINLIE